MPGLHFKIPFSIETVTKIKGSRYVFREEFGYRTARPGVRSELRRDASMLTESLMLTGDLNVATVEWVVQYRISEPKDYLFNLRNITTTIRDVAESVTRQIVGDHSVDEVWILLRPQIATQIKQQIQLVLYSYKSVIAIETV